MDVHFAANEVTGTRETSIQVAFNKWDAVSGATMTFDFRGDVTNYVFWDRIDCQPVPTNSVHWDSSIPNNTGFDAYSALCASNGDITSFEVGFDENSSVTWHNDDTSPPAGTLDLRSLAAHEAGHATGGWLNGSQKGHFNEGSTECPSNSTRHTMCPTIVFGTDWQRTLEAHDEHTFAGAY